MRFPKFWAKVWNQAHTVAANGWSELSQQDAQNQAQDRLGRILTLLRSRKMLDNYHYLTHDVIREEVLERFDYQGKELCVVSRNSYGAVVLNATKVLFIDIDVPLDFNPFAPLFNLFRKQKPKDNFEKTLDNIRDWQAKNSHYSLRIYRTHSGFRCIVLNNIFEDMTEATSILKQLGSDKLYILLCEKQQCFRARLTPKPWRLGLGRLYFNFPYDEVNLSMMTNWLDEYNKALPAYAVCHLVENLGETQLHPEVEFVLSLHDQLCSLDTNLPLA